MSDKMAKKLYAGKMCMSGKMTTKEKQDAKVMCMSSKMVKKQDADCRCNAHEWQNGKKKQDAGEIRVCKSYGNFFRPPEY